MDTESKAFETRKAIENGASEIDMVIHVGSLKDRKLDYLKNDIAAVVAAAQGKTVKVIIETPLLTDEEKTLACKASLEAKAHFVKTSTGFGGRRSCRRRQADEVCCGYRLRGESIGRHQKSRASYGTD